MWRKGACRIKQQALSFLTSREGPYRQQPTAVFVWYTNNFSRTFPSYLPVCSWAAVTLFVTNVRTVFRFRTGCTLVAAMQWLNVANIDRTSELNCWWVLMQSTHWRRSIWCKSLMQLGLRQCFFFIRLTCALNGTDSMEVKLGLEYGFECSEKMLHTAHYCWKSHLKLSTKIIRISYSTWIVCEAPM